MITDEKIQVIAQCFAETNFLNKSLALRNAGYSPKYAKGVGQKLLDNVRVKAAVDKIREDNKAKFEVTEALITKELTDIAMNTKETQPAVSVRAWDTLGRIIGVFSEDNAQKQPQTANIAIIESEAALDALELKLIQKQKALGNAICEG